MGYQKLNRNKDSFTIIELLIVVTLIVLLAAASLSLLNPVKQLKKAWDSRRKADLSTMQKAFEDFYNDKNHYPLASDVCYGPNVINENGVCSCFICGWEKDTPDFSPYLRKLPCDPQHPQKAYYYQYDCSVTFPNWFKICTFLNELPASTVYNYGVASPNVNADSCLTVSLPQQPVGPTSTPAPITPSSTFPAASPTSAITHTPTPTVNPPTPTSAIITPSPTSQPLPTCPPNIYCYKGIDCKICGTLENCLKPEICDNPNELYSVPHCLIRCYY
ncbi:MAG: prepilin-type N-terminal cleavage/methylation domain-containing protein [Microgenomates group bacterium]|nr:prepilin-type N-terminal cleavage/methylation domain-containing protein [Microgenomates group bacterium]